MTGSMNISNAHVLLPQNLLTAPDVPLGYINDAYSYTYSWVNITDAPHYVEIYCQRESADGEADGIARMWIDGSQVAEATNVQNFNQFILTDCISVGATTLVTADMSGDYYLDKIVVNKDGAAIGA